MNLLDQLFQYSQRSDISSISFAVLDQDDNIEISSISHSSFIYSAPSPSLNKVSIDQDDSIFRILPLNLQENNLSNSQTQSFIRYKEKYKKIYRLGEILSNKIRKVKYEFLVKLENRYKNLQSSYVFNTKNCQEFTNSKSIIENNSRRSSNFMEIMSLINTTKRSDLLRHGFAAIKRKSLCKERLQILCSLLEFILKPKLKSYMKCLCSATKPKIELKIDFPKPLSIKVKNIQVKIDNPIQSCYSYEEKIPPKLPIVHPQRRETQNFDISDNLNIFLKINSQLFQKPTSQGKTLEVSSVVRDFRESDCITEKRRSVLTNLSQTVSHFESCIKTFTQQDFEAKKEGEIHLVGLSCQKQRSEKCSITKLVTQQNIQPCTQDEQKCQSMTRRFSLQNHQSQLNKYIIFRRSIEKKKISTLKQIEKSKETIKKIVYELQKSKNKHEKPKIKLNANKVKQVNKSSQRKTPAVQSAKCSPVRSKTIGVKTSRASSSKKNSYADQKKGLTSRQLFNLSQNPIIEGVEPYPILFNEMQMYENYVKFKKNGKHEQSSHKKQSGKGLQSANFKKNNPSKNPKSQNGLMTISKDPVVRQRRIDVKVDLGKPCSTGGIQQQKDKLGPRKIKNSMI